MFIPLAVRQEFERRPFASWALCAVIALLNLSVVVLPSWILQIRHEELVRLFCFDPQGRRWFNYLTYGFLVASPWVLLLDLAGILLWGVAVESIIGRWRLLVIFVLSAAAAAAVHAVGQPSIVVVGATGGVMGLLGAAIMTHGFSEMTGVALWPFARKSAFELRAVPTMFVVLTYAAVAGVWAILAAIEDIPLISRIGKAAQEAEGSRLMDGVYAIIKWAAKGHLMGWQGQIAGFAVGAGSVAIFLRGKTPAFHPSQLDLSHIRRQREREQNERLQRELGDGGLMDKLMDNVLGAGTLPGFEPGGLDSLGVEGAPAQAEAAAPAESADPEMLKGALAKMVGFHNPTELAEAYKRFIALYPDEALPGGEQADMGRQLEKNFYYDLALDAFEKLARKHPTSPLAPQGLLAAGRLCLHFEGRERDGLRYLEQFMATHPMRQEEIEAEKLMQALRKKGGAQEAAPVPGGALPPPMFQAPIMPAGEEPLRLDSLFTGPPPAAPPAQAGEAPRAEPPKPRMASAQSLGSAGSASFAGPHRQGFVAPPGRHKVGGPAGAEEDSGIFIQPEEDPAAPPQPPAPPAKAGSKTAPTEDDHLDLDLDTAWQEAAETEPDRIEFEREHEFGAKALTPTSARRATFALIFEPKAALQLGAVARVLAAREGAMPELLEQRLQEGKGIVLRDLPLEDAREIRAECLAQGQRLIIAEQTPDLEFARDIREAQSMAIEGGTIRWRSGGETVETPIAEAMLLSAGRVRVPPRTGHRRRNAVVFFQQPHLAVEVWESTLDYAGESGMAELKAREAFREVCRALAEACPSVQQTGGFRRMLNETPESRPLSFRSQEEFANYNQWHLWAYFAPKAV